MEDVIGIARTQSLGLMFVQYESMSKRIQHGFAARNGPFVALVPRKEYTGIDKVFEQHGIHVKLYASMIATCTPNKCIQSLEEKHTNHFANLDSIRKITWHNPRFHSSMVAKKQRDRSTPSAPMSIRYLATVQLVDRLVLTDPFTAPNLDHDVV